MSKEYLGDSVYASFDGFHIILTTENGFSPTNTIFLDDHTVESLLRYIEKQLKIQITTMKGEKYD